MAGDLTLSLECDALPGAHTYSVHGVEQISKPFEFQIEIATAAQAGANLEEAISTGAALVFRRGENELRRIVGIVAQVRDVPLGDNRNYIGYAVKFVPRLWRLSMTETTDIYMDMSVPDIVKKKLTDAGLASDQDFEFRLKGKYPPREFVVQYQESDLNFISRLLEHIGIYFFFEHDEKDKVVFSDSKSVLKPVSAPHEIQFSHTDSAENEDLRITSLTSVTRALPHKYIVRDYNYRSPGMDLRASATVLESGTGDVVEYGAHFKTPEDGSKIARVRAEELRATRIIFSGSSNAHQITPGATFKVEGHPRGDVELQLLRVMHSVEQPVMNLHRDNVRAYRNDFTAIPKDTEFRPHRDARKPVVSGVVTGIVDAAAKGNYAELDAEGRYKVKFMYDTAERGEGQASRPVRMAQPSSGPGYGMHFPLRPGIEVILSCVNGDPDRPIIAGTVPNPETGSPVTQGNQNRNIIKTGGGTEMNFDDTAGEHRLKISVPHADTSFQLGSPNSPERGAILSTAESYSAYAGQVATQVSNAANVFAATAKFLASSDITSFAGVSNAFDKVEGALAVIDAAGKFVGDAEGLPKAWNDISLKRAKAAAASYGAETRRSSAELARAKAIQTRRDGEAQLKVDAARRDLDAAAPGGVCPAPDGMSGGPYDRYVAAERRYNDALAEQAATNKTTKTTVDNAKAREDKAKEAQANDPDAKAAQVEADAMQAEADAAAAEDAADADSSTWGDLKKGAGIAVDAYKKVKQFKKDVGTIKDSAKTLMSGASSAASEAAKGGAAGIVAGAIGAGTAFAALPRVSGSVGSLAKSWNVQGATGTAAMFGLANAVVASPVNTSVSAGAMAVLGGGAKAIVHSPAAAEVTGVARALMTSGALIDLKSGARLKTFSGALTTINAGASIVASAGAAMSLSAKGQMKLKAGPKIDAKASNIKLEGSAKVDVKTADFGVKASSNVKMTGNSSTLLKTGGVSMSLKGGKAKLGLGNAFAEMQSSKTMVKGGPSSVELKGGGATVKGPKVTVSGSGGVKVTGAKIELG